MKKALTDTTKQVMDALEAVLTAVDLRNSRIKKLSKVKVTEDTLTVELPDYATYVDEGRLAGKNPPVPVILKWLKRKRIKAPKGVTPTQFAYMIANTIGKEGVKAKPFIDNFAERMEQITFKTVNIEIDNQLKKI